MFGSMPSKVTGVAVFVGTLMLSGVATGVPRSTVSETAAGALVSF
jgi:hypothetical protein